MDNLDDLKALWLSAKTDSLPPPEEMLRMVKKFRNQKLRRKVILVVVAFLLGGLMLWATLMNKASMVSTHIGGALLLITFIILAITNLRSIKRFYNLKDCSNSDFVKFIERTRQNQIYFYKKTQV